MASTPRYHRGAMTMDTPWMEEELLAHAAWVRELARGLVRDASDADDLAQDTFVAALRGAPRERGAARAWLAGIARRLAWKRQRDRHRELALDQAALERAGTSSPQAIERLELHELLARELRALREPLRAALIERYVHGRSAAEIAEQSGVPLPTVRSRLQLGLEELRSRLDRRFDGDRETWMSALVLAAGSKAAGASALGGGLLVSTLAKVAIGAVALVAGVWLLRTPPNVPDVPIADGADAASRAAPLETATVGMAHATEATSNGSARRNPVPAATASPPTELPAVIVRGRTVDEAGRPIAGVELGCTELAWSKRLLWEQAPAECFPKTTSAADGRFTLATHLPEPAPPGVIVTIEARKPGFCRVQLRTGERTNELDVGDLPLGSAARVAGRVCDARGLPCPGVSIRVSPTHPTHLDAPANRRPSYGGETHSALDGSFAFDDAPAAACTLSAYSDDLRQATLAVDLSSGESKEDVALVLPELDGADSISGTVVDPQGRAVPKAALHERKTSGPGEPRNLSTACDERGRFRIDGCAGASFEILARDRACEFGPVLARDVPAGTHALVLRLDGERTFLLRVHDAQGGAVERFSCERRDESFGFSQDGAPLREHPSGEARLPADVRPFLLRIQSPGFAACALGPFDPQTMAAVVDARLERACTIRGVVHGSADALVRASVTLAESNLRSTPSSFGPLPPARAKCAADGSFEMTLEGTGTVRLVARSGELTSSPSGAIRVEPGLDVNDLMLELARGGAIEGRVLRNDGAPAPGFTVNALLGARIAASTSVGKGGEFLLRGLAPGEYELRVSGPNRAIHFDTPRTAPSAQVQHWTCAVGSNSVEHCELRLLDTVRVHVHIDLPEHVQKTWPATFTSWPGEGASTQVEDLEVEAQCTRDFEFVDPLDLLVELGSGSAGGVRLASARRHLLRGDNELAIRLHTGRIEGRLGEPFSTRERIELAWSSDGLHVTAEAQPDAQGAFHFDCAPAGTCSLRRVLVPATRPVEVTEGETAHADGL